MVGTFNRAAERGETNAIYLFCFVTILWNSTDS